MATTSSTAARIARVGAFGIVLALGSWAFWAWRAPPPPPELRLGELLAAYAPPEDGGAVLVVNGVRVRTVVGGFEQDLDAVLPRLRAACEEADPEAALGVARRERVATTADSASVVRGVDRAMVSCAPVEGRVLHLYAEATRDGVAVRALSSEGPLPILGAEEERDARGSDLAGVPRPEGSRRVLSVFSSDARYGMVQLVLPDAGLDAQRDAYAGALEAAGFDVDTPPGDDADTRTLVAQRGARRVVIVLDRGAGREAFATLLDQGGA